MNMNEAIAFDVPTGTWRNGLCGCFDACCCPFWMGCCCFPILMGQVMERLNFDFWGCPRIDRYRTSLPLPICPVYTAITIFVFVLGLIAMGTVQLGFILCVIWCWYMLVVFTCTRMNMRKKYKIEPICCGDNCCDDCCTVFFCSCCSAIQMTNHTHDPVVYPYNCTTRNGLNPDDPHIV